MWALGCILYEIWTQDSSFVNQGFGMATKLGTDPELLNKLGDMAIVLILSMMFSLLLLLFDIIYCFNTCLLINYRAFIGACSRETL